MQSDISVKGTCISPYTDLMQQLTSCSTVRDVYLQAGLYLIDKLPHLPDIEAPVPTMPLLAANQY